MAAGSVLHPRIERPGPIAPDSTECKGRVMSTPSTPSAYDPAEDPDSDPDMLDSPVDHPSQAEGEDDGRSEPS